MELPDVTNENTCLTKKLLTVLINAINANDTKVITETLAHIAWDSMCVSETPQGFDFWNEWRDTILIGHVAGLEDVPRLEEITNELYQSETVGEENVSVGS